MNEMAPARLGASVAEYKGVLRRVLDNRPSGTRQRLALALGKNRSFVSQIANPSYPVPIPAQHVETIFEVCHFSLDERKSFLEAYRHAHARRKLEAGDSAEAARHLHHRAGPGRRPPQPRGGRDGRRVRGAPRPAGGGHFPIS